MIIIPRQFLWCGHDGQSCFGSSPGSFDECRLRAGWRPSQSTWDVSPPVGCCHPHHHRHCCHYLARKLMLILPSHGGGWVDLGTAVKVRSPYPRLYIAAAVAINKLTAVRGVIQTWVLSPQADTLTTRPVRPGLKCFETQWRVSLQINSSYNYFEYPVWNVLSCPIHKHTDSHHKCWTWVLGPRKRALVSFLWTW